MQKGKKVLVINQSVPDFEAYVYSSSDLYETANVVLVMPDEGEEDVTTMTFSYSDIQLID